MPSQTDEISARFRQARAELQLSAAQLAAKVGAAEGTIRDYERGKSVPGGLVIAGLANAGVSPVWLLLGEGPMLRKDLDRAAPPIDSSVLAGVISGVEEALTSQGRELDPAKKSELVTLLYEQCVAEGGEVRTATILRLVKLAA